MDKHLFTRKGFTLAAHAGSLAQRVQNDGRAHRLYAAAQQGADAGDAVTE